MQAPLKELVMSLLLVFYSAIVTCTLVFSAWALSRLYASSQILVDRALAAQDQAQRH